MASQKLSRDRQQAIEETAARSELINRECELRYRLYENGQPSSEKIRKWWTALEDLSKAYSEAFARYATGQRDRPDPPFPPEVLGVLRMLAGELAVGSVPEVVLLAAKRGRHDAGPAERRARGLAVAYLKACDKEGLTHMGRTIKVDDPNPFQTLEERYGVKRGTLSSWIKKHKPSGLGVTAITSEVLVDLTQRAGARYQTAGRSEKALWKRDSRGARK